MTTSQPLPFTELELHRLPAPLSSALSNLVQEQQQSGLSTTADETCDAIEAWFKTVGGLLRQPGCNGAPAPAVSSTPCRQSTGVPGC